MPFELCPGAGSRRLLLLPALVLGLLQCACPGGAPGGSTGAPAESLSTALEHGDAVFREGDYEEAQVAYEHALKAEPDNRRAVVGLGTCYLKNRQVKRATELLTGHLKRHPDNVAARLVLARCLLRQAELDAAAAELRQVLAADPDNLMAHYNLGFLAYRGRDYDVAADHLRRTIALRPEHPEAHYTLGLTRLAQDRLPEAITELQETVRLDPKHVGAHFNLAKAASRAGNMLLAEKHQALYADLSGRSKAESERAQQAKASSLKAVEFLMAQNYPEALAEYRRLIEAHPDYAPLYNDIGRVQLKLGQRQEALESLKRAVELDPRLSEPHYLLANIYRELGDAEAAARELQVFATLETIPEGKSGY